MTTPTPVRAGSLCGCPTEPEPAGSESVGGGAWSGTVEVHHTEDPIQSKRVLRFACLYLRSCEEAKELDCDFFARSHGGGDLPSREPLAIGVLSAVGASTARSPE